MTRLKQIQEYREQGLTFEQIGNIWGISRQRVHAIFTGYTAKYQKTEKYKNYERHRKNHIDSQNYPDCSHCQAENMSIGLSTGTY